MTFLALLAALVLVGIFIAYIIRPTKKEEKEEPKKSFEEVTAEYMEFLSKIGIKDKSNILFSDGNQFYWNVQQKKLAGEAKWEVIDNKHTIVAKVEKTSVDTLHLDNFLLLLSNGNYRLVINPHYSPVVDVDGNFLINFKTFQIKDDTKK